jgi:hypothetical protein
MDAGYKRTACERASTGLRGRYRVGDMQVTNGLSIHDGMIAEFARPGMGGNAQNARRGRPAPVGGMSSDISPMKITTLLPLLSRPYRPILPPNYPGGLREGESVMQGITGEQLGRAVGMRLALELLADMQRERPGERYPERAVRARAAAALRGEQEAWAVDGPPLPEDARKVALRTMMDLLEAVIDRW